MKLNLMNLFDGYVRNYHTLNLTTEHGKHSFTMAEIEYFSRLGVMLGYYSYTEDTCNGSYRPMDLTWWGNFDGEVWHDFVLHLERENFFHKDIETLEKLFSHKEWIPENVIGIMNVKDYQRVEELVEEAKKMCNVDNALLIFRTNSPNNKARYFDKVYAYLLNKENVMKEKEVFVSEIANTLFMDFEKVEVN